MCRVIYQLDLRFSRISTRLIVFLKHQQDRVSIFFKISMGRFHAKFQYQKFQKYLNQQKDFSVGDCDKFLTEKTRARNGFASEKIYGHHLNTNTSSWNSIRPMLRIKMKEKAFFFTILFFFLLADNNSSYIPGKASTLFQIVIK